LIAFLAFLAFLDAILSYIGSMVDHPEVSFKVSYNVILNCF
jgi:nucleoside permease NupC